MPARSPNSHGIFEKWTDRLLRWKRDKWQYNQSHLNVIIREAQEIVSNALGQSDTKGKCYGNQ